MSVRQYQEKGQTLYLAEVSLRSRISPAIRASRAARGFKTEAEARRAEKDLLRDAQRLIFERERAGSSWGEVVARWSEALHAGKGSERALQLTTILDNVRALELYTGAWSNRPAASITKADVKQVLEAMAAEGKSMSRRRAIKNAINGAFTWGIESGVIRGVTQSPAYGLKIGKSEEACPEILTLSQIRTLLEAAKATGHPYYPVWAMALLTGMRSGELQALLWTDVSLETRRILVSKSYNGRMKSVKSTKAGYSREVPISEELEALLKALRAEAPTRPHVLPRFTDWERGEAARVLRAFCEGIGLPSVRFHALRACFATQLLRDRVAPAVVMKICGWRDLKTMQRYIRLAGIEIEGATEGLKLLPPSDVMGRVVELFAGKSTT